MMVQYYNKWRMPLKELHIWRQLFLSILYKIIHIFNILKAIRDLGCNISELIKSIILLWSVFNFFLWLSVIRNFEIYFRSTFLALKKERNHVWFSDQSEANRKMSEQKWNAVLMAIENLIQVFCNNTSIIGKNRIWKFKFI